MAHEAGRVVVRIDGRNIEATPLGFIVALSRRAQRRPLRAVGRDRRMACGRRPARRHLRVAHVARRLASRDTAAAITRRAA